MSPVSVAFLPSICYNNEYPLRPATNRLARTQRHCWSRAEAGSIGTQERFPAAVHEPGWRDTPAAPRGNIINLPPAAQVPA